MSNLVMGYYRFAERVMRFAYVNLLWVLFTVAGLGIFGFMPATTAMFAVLRKWNLQEKDVPVFPLFWKVYKSEFIKSNLLGLFLGGSGYLLITAYFILRGNGQTVFFLASFGILALMLLYSIILTYFFPISVHFHLRLADYIKWPFIIGIIHPILTAVLIVGIGTLVYVTYSTLPALLLFFGGSVPAYLLMKGVSQTFSKYESVLS